MASQLVFSGNLDPANPNLSIRFVGATSFFIQAPSLAGELEIDCFLQVYLPGIVGETARNIPLGKIEAQAITLNIADTETASVIPAEFLDTGLEMALLFLASDTTFLYVTVIQPDCSLCSISGQINQVQNSLDQVLVGQTEFTNQINQLDAGVFSVAQGISRLLPNQQGRNLRRNTDRRLNLDRTFL